MKRGKELKGRLAATLIASMLAVSLVPAASFASFKSMQRQPTVKSMEFNPKSIEMEAGEDRTLTLEFTYDEAASKSQLKASNDSAATPDDATPPDADLAVTFTSSDENIIKVERINNTSCKVTALNEGPATVHAVAGKNDKYKADCSVKVKFPAVEASLSREKIGYSDNSYLTVTYKGKENATFEVTSVQPETGLDYEVVEEKEKSAKFILTPEYGLYGEYKITATATTNSDKEYEVTTTLNVEEPKLALTADRRTLTLGGDPELASTNVSIDEKKSEFVDYDEYRWSVVSGEDLVEMASPSDAKAASVEVTAKKAGKAVIGVDAVRKDNGGPKTDRATRDTIKRTELTLTIEDQTLPVVNNDIKSEIVDGAVKAPTIDTGNLTEEEAAKVVAEAMAQKDVIESSIKASLNPSPEFKEILTSLIKGTAEFVKDLIKDLTGDDEILVYPKQKLENVNLESQVLVDETTGKAQVVTYIKTMRFDISMFMQKKEITGSYGAESEVKGVSSKEVTFPLALPEEGINPNHKAVKITHKGKSFDRPILEGNGGRYVMISANSFSPFELEFEDDIPGERVKVKVENVKNGVLVVYDSNNKYLPLDEEVEIRKGETLTIDPSGLLVETDDDEIWYDCMKLTATENGKENVIAEDSDGIYGRDVSFTVNGDVTLKGYFEQEKSYDDDDVTSTHAPNLRVKPSYILSAGNYEGVVTARVWDETSRRYVDGGKDVTLALNLANRDSQFFQFDPQTNILKSNGALSNRRYVVEFSITYQGKTWNGDVSIRGGAIADYYIGLAKYKGAYNEYLSANVDARIFNYTPGMAYGSLLSGVQPSMYNYEFKGWMNESGKTVNASDTVKLDGSSASLFARFEKADGTSYNVTIKDGSGQDSNQNNQNNSNNSSKRSRSSGGSSKSFGENSIHGNWEAVNGQWKFKQFNGQYATNQWGKVNNYWYFFDEAGNMVTGWRFINGNWYFMSTAKDGTEGRMMTGWMYDPIYNNWFLLDQSNGSMLTGWQFVNGKWYYLNPVSDGSRGAMATDTVIEGYYVGPDGARQ